MLEKFIHEKKAANSRVHVAQRMCLLPRHWTAIQFTQWQLIMTSECEAHVFRLGFLLFFSFRCSLSGEILEQNTRSFTYGYSAFSVKAIIHYH